MGWLVFGGWWLVSLSLSLFFDDDDDDDDAAGGGGGGAGDNFDHSSLRQI